jgi:alkanesulfonate monooxygenase SsuD/methylene tetrahydromethanopterin reductase-like flavin-dependent oxidoreductase (luciferase family)
LPLPDGQGKSLKLNFHPERNYIPIFLGAIGRKSVEIAAEIADGWIPIFFSVDKFEEAWGEHIEIGLEKGGRTREDFEISPSVQVAIDGDTEAARNMVRMGLVLYFGGMGSRKTNFYVDLAHRFGFGEVADEVQELFQAGEKEAAFQALPDEVVDAVSLIGSEEEVVQRLAKFRESGISRLIATPVHTDPAEQKHTIERLAAIAG